MCTEGERERERKAGEARSRCCYVSMKYSMAAENAPNVAHPMHIAFGPPVVKDQVHVVEFRRG